MYPTEIDLNNQNLTNSVIIERLQALPNKQFITVLNLSGNYLSGDLAHLLDFLLQQCSNLQKIGLITNNAFTVKEIHLIGNFLTNHAALKSVNLYASCSGSDRIKALATSLKNNKHPLELGLGKNEITAADISYFINTVQGSNYFLNLTYNQIEDAGVEALSKHLHKLRGLVLPLNDITMLGITSIASCLATNNTLQLLNVGCNPLKQLPQTISTAFATNTTLKHLICDQAELDSHSCLLLCTIIRTNKTLLSLKLDNNYFTEEDGNALQSALAQNKALYLCSLENNVSVTQKTQAIINTHCLKSLDAQIQNESNPYERRALILKKQEIDPSASFTLNVPSLEEFSLFAVKKYHTANELRYKGSPVCNQHTGKNTLCLTLNKVLSDDLLQQVVPIPR